MNLCFISSEYPPGPHGGSGTFTQVFARALHKAGHRVRVAGVYPRDYPAPDYEQDQGVQVWRLRERRFHGAWAVSRFQLFRLIRRWIKNYELDLVEAPDHQGWFAGWPKLSVPLVQRAGGAYSYFAYEMGGRAPRDLFRLEKWSYDRADSWIAKSQYTARITAKVFKLKSGPGAVLYNPVDAPASAPSFSERTANQVVFTGTLTHKKGIISLIEAWSSVVRRVPEAELHIYGKNGKTQSGEPMMSHLQGLLPLELLPTVTFHGHVTRDRLFQALSTARVAVFPSFSEGFAWAPLEAMAHGCPTIHTSLGSGPELITDEVNGLLVDPGQTAQIGEAIVRMLTDSSLAERLGKAGRAHVTDHFTLEKLLPVNEAFYQDLINSFGHRQRLS